jgi:hypothetical protein
MRLRLTKDDVVVHVQIKIAEVLVLAVQVHVLRHDSVNHLVALNPVDFHLRLATSIEHEGSNRRRVAC